jgi:hypothetical protein
MKAPQNDLVLPTEADARAYLETIRWPNGPFCPYCRETADIAAADETSAPATHLQCGTCNARFTVTTGSMMERSHVPLHKWPVVLRQLGDDAGLPLDTLMLRQFSPTPSDPDLRLLADGRTTRAHTVRGLTYEFTLPAGASDVAAVSRHVVPAEHAAMGTDFRKLGVCILKIRVSSAAFEQVWQADDAVLLHGFYAREGGHRWTNGHARLPAFHDAHRGKLDVEIQLGSGRLNYGS